MPWRTQKLLGLFLSFEAWKPSLSLWIFILSTQPISSSLFVFLGPRTSSSSCRAVTRISNFTVPFRPATKTSSRWALHFLSSNLNSRFQDWSHGPKHWYSVLPCHSPLQKHLHPQLSLRDSSSPFSLNSLLPWLPCAPFPFIITACLVPWRIARARRRNRRGSLHLPWLEFNRFPFSLPWFMSSFSLLHIFAKKWLLFFWILSLSFFVCLFLFVFFVCVHLFLTLLEIFRCEKALSNAIANGGQCSYHDFWLDEFAFAFSVCASLLELRAALSVIFHQFLLFLGFPLDFAQLSCPLLTFLSCKSRPKTIVFEYRKRRRRDRTARNSADTLWLSLSQDSLSLLPPFVPLTLLCLFLPSEVYSCLSPTHSPSSPSHLFLSFAALWRVFSFCSCCSYILASTVLVSDMST